MIKRIFLAAALMGSAATAGPYYGNVESNGSWTDGDFGRATDFHVGIRVPHENSKGDGEWFIQAGPMLEEPNGSDPLVGFSAKAGAEVTLPNDVELYGEVNFANGDETVVGTQIGATFPF